MATIACQFCGHVNAASRSSCANCGAPLPAAAPRPPAGPAQFRPPAPARRPQSFPTGRPGTGMPLMPTGGQPKKRKTGLFVGVGVVVIGLVALLITGFVAPGFLKSTTGGHKEEPAASEAVKQKFADKFMAAVNGQKKSVVVGLFCERSKSASAQLLAKFKAKVGQKNASSPNTLAFDITVHGVSESIASAELKPVGSRWCIGEFGFLAPDAPVNKVKVELRKIQASLKDGKVGGISRKLCPEVPKISAKLIGTIRKNKGQIDVDDPIDVNGQIYQGNARMTLSDYSGETVGNGFLVLDSIDAGRSWCVSEFSMDYR